MVPIEWIKKPQIRYSDGTHHKTELNLRSETEKKINNSLYCVEELSRKITLTVISTGNIKQKTEFWVLRLQTAWEVMSGGKSILLMIPM